MKKLLCCTTVTVLLANPLALLACEASESARQCGVVVIANKIAAVFPVSNPSRTKWEWNRVIVDPDLPPEYAWITEVGECIDGSFKKHDIAFAISVRNQNDERAMASGSLDDLIRLNKFGAVYLNSPDRFERNEADGPLREIYVEARLHEGDIWLLSADSRLRSVMFKGMPTHAMQTAILPYENESYTCITEIIYE